MLVDKDRKVKVFTSKILKNVNSSCQHDSLQTKHKLVQTGELDREYLYGLNK